MGASAWRSAGSDDVNGIGSSGEFDGCRGFEHGIDHGRHFGDRFTLHAKSNEERRDLRVGGLASENLAQGVCGLRCSEISAGDKRRKNCRPDHGQAVRRR